MPELRIAFLILAHGDAPQLKRLCVALQPHSIFVHIDAKAIDVNAAEIADLPGVTIIEPPIDVHWGDFSMIQATLTLMRTAQAAKAFGRYVLLSGSCYPVKPMAFLEVAFQEEPRREWINLTAIDPASPLAGMTGRRWRMAPFVQQSWLDAVLRTAWNMISGMRGRDFAREIQMIPYFGSQWWALTNDCVAMILEFAQSHPAFSKAYSSVYAPDEHFFHTIIGNSRFAALAHQVEDRGANTNQAVPLHLISPAQDRYWGSGDADFAVVAGTSQFFIRKVSAERTSALLNRIDAELLCTDSRETKIEKP